MECTKRYRNVQEDSTVQTRIERYGTLQQPLVHAISCLVHPVYLAAWVCVMNAHRFSQSKARHVSALLHLRRTEAPGAFNPFWGLNGM